MRVLVTGARGFVGSHIVPYFETHDAEVVGIDLGDAFPCEPADVVVSLAATADPRHALTDPVAAYANSTRIMIETLEYAREHGARVLHVSTNEAHPPSGPYGGAKACQEIVCETYGDVPVTIVVTQSLFGERQQRDKLVPTAIRAILNETPIRLQCGADARPRWARRPFLHVRNLAAALTWLATAKAESSVNVGAVEVWSVRNVVRELEDVLGRRALVEPVSAGDRPGHENAVRAIGCNVVDWQPSYDARTAFRDVAAWYLEHQEWL